MSKSIKYVLLSGYYSNEVIAAKVAEVLGTTDCKYTEFCYDGGAVSTICHTGTEDISSDFAWEHLGNGFIGEWMDDYEEQHDNPFAIVSCIDRGDAPVYIEAHVMNELDGVDYEFLGMLTGYMECCGEDDEDTIYEPYQP